jgi:hypothetical protein
LVITVLLAVSTAGVWAFVRLRDAREAEAARRIAFMDSDSLFEAAFASSHVSLTPWMWASIGETMTLQNEVRARGDAMLVSASPGGPDHTAPAAATRLSATRLAGGRW